MLRIVYKRDFKLPSRALLLGQGFIFKQILPSDWQEMVSQKVVVFRYLIHVNLNEHTEPKSGERPPVEEDVIVETPSFRCLGFLGLDGKWHSAYNGLPLDNVIGWEPLG